jgi:stage II sporulation protein D
MRHLLALAVLVGALAALGSAWAAPRPATVFVLAGGGWGHGVGMSQWGAFGQAQAGRDYRAILAHYYPGTTLGPSPVTVPPKLRVLVAEGLGSASVGAAGPIAVVDGAGKRARQDGPVTIGSSLRLASAAEPKSVQLQAPVTLRAVGGGQLVVAGKAYRGALRIAQAGGKLRLVNVVALESYLLGVVPGEMPKEWPLEALKAQAVAARTYAVANLVEGRNFDLYSDTRSQLYYGADAEAPGPTRAVEETRGQVLSFAGAPAETFYFSSSGGSTLSALDAFGQEVPYLHSVEDTWDSVSPHHQWQTQLIGPAQLARRLGLRGAVADVSRVPGVPGTPAAIRVVTGAGASVEQKLADVRSRLGLKSLAFHLGVLRLDRPEGAQPKGSVRLTGLARDVAGATLQRRTATGDWVDAARIAPASDGSFSIRARVVTTTAFRLAVGGLTGPIVTVRIAA